MRWEESWAEKNEAEKNEEKSLFFSLVWIREKYEEKNYSPPNLLSFVWKRKNKLSKEKNISCYDQNAIATSPFDSPIPIKLAKIRTSKVGEIYN